MPRFFLMISSFALTLTATPIMAETSAMAAHFFARFDADGSQSVTLNELAEKRTAEFMKFDMDGNRLLSSEEFARLSLAQAAHQATPEVAALGEKPHRILGALSLEESDLDHDGTVSKAEYQGNSALWFSTVDQDQDGAITAGELDAW